MNNNIEQLLKNLEDTLLIYNRCNDRAAEKATHYKAEWDYDSEDIENAREYSYQGGRVEGMATAIRCIKKHFNLK